MSPSGVLKVGLNNNNLGNNSIKTCYGARPDPPAGAPCNTCQDVVDAYQARGWAYVKANFAQCASESAPVAPVAPGKATAPYTPKEFVVYTNGLSDIPGNPLQGTVASCSTACSANDACMGFSRSKQVADTSVGECWLKRDLGQPKTLNDPTWRTFTPPSG
jgi:hypothetical protein